MSDSGGWDRVEALFDQAVSLPPEERRKLLDRECRDDPDLRRDLESLLSASEESPDYLRRLSNEVLGPNVRDLLNDASESPAEAPAPLVGTTVGRYEVLDQLASRLRSNS